VVGTLTPTEEGEVESYRRVRILARCPLVKSAAVLETRRHGRPTGFKRFSTGSGLNTRAKNSTPTCSADHRLEPPWLLAFGQAALDLLPNVVL